METRAHYVLIGAFMLGAIMLAILFTLWLTSAEREYDEYEIIFTQKISGLEEGANVLFNGIRVGEVDNLRLDPDNPNQSLALVHVTKGTPVKTDTAVELEIVGVTGLAVVQFSGGSSSAPMLNAISNNRIPQIAADLTGIAAVLETSGDIVLNLQRLLNQENAESVSRILADIEAVTDAVSDRETEIGLIIDNIAFTSVALRRSAENLDETTANLNRIMVEVDDLVASDVRAAIGEVSQAAEGFGTLASNVNSIIEVNRPVIDAFAQQGLGNAVSMLTRANRLVATTEAILQEFDRDPTRFLLGEGRPTAN